MHHRIKALAACAALIIAFTIFLTVTGGWKKDVVEPVSALFGASAGHQVDQAGKAVTSGAQSAASAAPSIAAQIGSGAAASITALQSIAATSDQRIPTYERSAFGPAWADVDHNGCDTRDDVLHRDLTGIQTRAGTNGCVVTSGALADPYTGTTILFSKAQASKVQIDHIVPLAYAWTAGAWNWSASEREDFANDETELLAVSGVQNTAKSDSGPSGWMPPNAGYRCTYVEKFVTVLAKYKLTITDDDRDSIAKTLASCKS